MSSYFSFGEITVTDFGWVPEYLAAINPFIEKHGGRVLARTTRFERTEGERPNPTNVILVEWPSLDAANAFFADPDYAPLRDRRRAGSRSQFYTFPAEDLAVSAKSASA